MEYNMDEGLQFVMEPNLTSLEHLFPVPIIGNSPTFEVATRKSAASQKKAAIYTSHQLKVLESEFRRSKYLRQIRRKELSDELCLSEANIKSWYTERRKVHKMNLSEALSLKKASDITERPVYFPQVPNSLVQQNLYYENYNTQKQSQPFTSSPPSFYPPTEAYQAPNYQVQQNPQFISPPTEASQIQNFQIQQDFRYLNEQVQKQSQPSFYSPTEAFQVPNSKVQQQYTANTQCVQYEQRGQHQNTFLHDDNELRSIIAKLIQLYKHI